MKGNRTGIIVIGSLALAAIVLAVLGPMLVSKREEGPNRRADRPSSSFLTAKGMVESADEAEIGSRVAGSIVKIGVREGEQVRRGQLLVSLDNGTVEAKIQEAEARKREAQAELREFEAGSRSEDVESARARMQRAEDVCRFAEDRFQRQERLYRKDAVTLLERNRAEEELKVAREELREARANLDKLLKGEREERVERARAAVAQSTADGEYYRSLLRDYAITSPIDGIVAERLREPGEAVDIGTPILRLVDPAKTRIRAEIEESDVGKVSEGDPVEVTVDAYPGKIYRGRVSRVFSVVRKRALKNFDPMASFDINTQKIHINLDDFSELKNGMTVTVKFTK